MTDLDLDRVLGPADFDDFLGELRGIFFEHAATRLLRLIGYPRRSLRGFSYDRRHADWEATFAEIDDGITGTPGPYRDLLHGALGRYPGNAVFLRVAALDTSRRRSAPAAGHAPSRVFVLHSSPGDRTRLRSEVKAIRRAAASGLLEIAEEQDAELLDLRGVLTFRPDVLHISGHGEAGELVFEDADGLAEPVPAARVVEVLAAYQAEGRLPRLAGVVLNSCDSAAVAKLFRPLADVVVAHGGKLENGCAIVFAGELYALLPGLGDVAAAARLAATHIADHCPVTAAGVDVWDGRP